MTITESNAIKAGTQAAQLPVETNASYGISLTQDYTSFAIETTKMADLPKIEKFVIKERGVYGKKGEQCHGKYYVIVRVNGEWLDLPALCEKFKCKVAGQNGFADREKAKAFGEKALAKWGVESPKASNGGAAAKLKELGFEYDKTSKKWVKITIEHRK